MEAAAAWSPLPRSLSKGSTSRPSSRQGESSLGTAELIRLPDENPTGSCLSPLSQSSSRPGSSKNSHRPAELVSLPPEGCASHSSGLSPVSNSAGLSPSRSSLCRLPDAPVTPMSSPSLTAAQKEFQQHSKKQQQHQHQQQQPVEELPQLPQQPMPEAASNASTAASFCNLSGTGCDLYTSGKTNGDSVRASSKESSTSTSATSVPSGSGGRLGEVNSGAGLTLPIAKAGDASAPQRDSGPRKTGLSAMRDRLRKDLSVSTAQVNKEQHVGGQVFRQLKPGETISDYYEFAEEIYSGGAKGKVLVAKRRSNGEEVIVKIRTKQTNRGGELSWRAIMAQVAAMKGSNHVLELTEILEDQLAYYVVMPRCNGGELFHFLVTETEVPEAECKRIIKEILIAVGHLHERGLIHRDVKPENIMFNMDKRDAKTPKTVKLIDFDTCVEWTPSSPKSSRFVGTPGYIAPEALLGEITPQSDLWSIGVILYILMTGETPWSSMVSLEDGAVGSPGARKMYQAIKQEVVQWDQEPWPDFPQARDLCQKLMAFNKEERACTVRQALDHPWLADAPTTTPVVSQ